MVSIGERATTVGIPELNSFIVAGGCQARAVRRPGHGIDNITMTGIGEDGIAGSCLPDLNGLIEASGGNVFTIRRPGYRVDSIAMAGISEDVTVVAGLPHAYCFIITPRSKHHAIG